MLHLHLREGEDDAGHSLPDADIHIPGILLRDERIVSLSQPPQDVLEGHGWCWGTCHDHPGYYAEVEITSDLDTVRTYLEDEICNERDGEEQVVADHELVNLLIESHRWQRHRLQHVARASWWERITYALTRRFPMKGGECADCIVSEA